MKWKEFLLKKCEESELVSPFLLNFDRLLFWNFTHNPLEIWMIFKSQSLNGNILIILDGINVLDKELLSQNVETQNAAWVNNEHL